MAARPLSPHAPQATESVLAHQGWKTAGPARPGSRRPALGALTRRAEGGGSGRVENKIRPSWLRRVCNSWLAACAFTAKRQPAGGHQAPARARQPIRRGMNRSGNAAVGRQIVKNRGSCPASPTSQRQTRVCPPSTSVAMTHPRAAPAGRCVAPLFPEPVHGKAA